MALIDMLVDRRRELLEIKYTRGLSGTEKRELAKVRSSIALVEEAEDALHLASVENLVVEMESLAARMRGLAEKAEEIDGKEETSSSGTG